MKILTITATQLIIIDWLFLHRHGAAQDDLDTRTLKIKCLECQMICLHVDFSDNQRIIIFSTYVIMLYK